MSRALSPRRIWGAPAALGVLSLVGLVAALVADGWGDALSWVALAVPAIVCARALWQRRAAAPSVPGSVPARRGVRTVDSERAGLGHGKPSD